MANDRVHLVGLGTETSSESKMPSIGYLYQKWNFGSAYLFFDDGLFI